MLWALSCAIARGTELLPVSSVGQAITEPLRLDAASRAFALRARLASQLVHSFETIITTFVSLFRPR
jgi:hypothetical protein